MARHRAHSPFHADSKQGPRFFRYRIQDRRNHHKIGRPQPPSTLLQQTRCHSCTPTSSKPDYQALETHARPQSGGLEENHVKICAPRDSASQTRIACNRAACGEACFGERPSATTNHLGITSQDQGTARLMEYCLDFSGIQGTNATRPFSA